MGKVVIFMQIKAGPYTGAFDILKSLTWKKGISKWSILPKQARLGVLITFNQKLDIFYMCMKDLNNSTCFSR